MNQNFVSSRWNRFATNRLQRYAYAERGRLNRIPLQRHEITSSDDVPNRRFSNMDEQSIAIKMVREIKHGSQTVWREYNQRWRLNRRNRINGEDFWGSFRMQPFNFSNGVTVNRSLYLYEYLKETYNLRMGDDIVDKLFEHDEGNSQINEITTSTDLYSPPVENETEDQMLERKLSTARRVGRNRMREKCEYLNYLWLNSPDMTEEQYEEISSSDNQPEPREVAEAEEQAENQRLFRLVFNE